VCRSTAVSTWSRSSSIRPLRPDKSMGMSERPVIIVGRSIPAACRIVGAMSVSETKS